MTTKRDPEAQEAVAEALQVVEEPIVVSASTIPAMLAAAGRVLTVLIAGSLAVMKFLSAKDVMGFWVWVQSSDGIAFGSALATAIAFGFSMQRTYVKHNKMIVLADAAPNEIGQVKSTTPV
jgi:hypothetical protein